MVRYLRGTLPLCHVFSALLARPSSDLSGPVAVKNHLEELMIGAVIAGQYRLDAYIMAGSFGHGWRAVDLQTGLEVFVKTFKSKECFSKHSNVMAGMVEELETAERISKVNHLMNHNNIVAVLKVRRPRGSPAPHVGMPPGAPQALQGKGNYLAGYLAPHYFSSILGEGSSSNGRNAILKTHKNVALTTPHSKGAGVHRGAADRPR